MNLRTKVEELGAKLSMRAPDGTTLTLLEPVLELDLRARTPLEIRLVFRISYPDWERTDQGAWFGLEPARRGPCFGGGFPPGEAIEITTRLPRQHMPLLASPAGERLWIAEVLQSAPLDSTLRQTESWRATKVVRATGPVKVGFRIEQP